jgi:hypothetical protein
MTNRTVKLLRKGWDSLLVFLTAMDYSALEYTDDRISRLEHEVTRLKDELRRIPRSAGTADAVFEPSARAREA